MMSDIFLEQLVAKKKTTSDKVKCALAITGGVIFSAVMLLILFAYKVISVSSGNEQMMASGQIIVPLGFLLIALAWYGIYLLLNTFKVEFEYSIANNELDIDKVMAKKGRKHLITVDIKNATRMAMVEGDVKEFCKKAPEGVKVLNYSAMSDTGYTYYIDCSVDDERRIVLWQPTAKMVEALWRYNPRAVERNKE